MEDNRKGEAAETKKSSQIIKIEEEKLHNHLDEVVRGTVEETLNALLQVEADALVWGTPLRTHRWPARHACGALQAPPANQSRPG